MKYCILLTETLQDTNWEKLVASRARYLYSTLSLLSRILFWVEQFPSPELKVWKRRS